MMKIPVCSCVVVVALVVSGFSDTVSGSVLDRLRQTFPAIAAEGNLSLRVSLNRSIFQMIGYTPEQVFAAMGPAINPSKRLINLLNTSTILQLEKSHGVITESAPLAGKNYSYSVMSYLSSALALDSSSITKAISKALSPVIGGSVAAFLNTTEAAFNNRSYLTDVYPTLKRLLPVLISDTASSYYKSLSKVKLSILELKELFGNQTYESFKDLRLKIAKSALEIDSRSLATDYQQLSTRLHANLQRLRVLQNVQTMPLNASFVLCRIHPSVIPSLTFSDLFRKCVNVSKDFPLSKLMFFNPSTTDEINFGEAAKLLQLSLTELGRYMMFDIKFKISTAFRQRVTYVKKPLISIASLQNISLAKLSLMKVYDIGPKITNIPENIYYILSGVAKKQQSNITLKAIPGISVKAIATAMFPDILKSIAPYNQSLVKNAVSKGLFYIAYNVPISNISNWYNITGSLLERHSVISLAMYISGVSREEFAKLFRMKERDLAKIKMTIGEGRVLLKIQNSSKPIEDYTPLGLAGFFTFLPSTLTRLVDTVSIVSKSSNKALEDLTFTDVKNYGPWNDIYVGKLLKALGLSVDQFNSLKLKKLSVLSQSSKIPLQQLANMSIIGLFKALLNPLYKPDPCKSKSCPTSSTCRNIPSVGAVCRCSKPLQEIKNNACAYVKSKIIKVTGMKFNQQYTVKYNDKSSTEFQSKAAEIENVLYIVICKKITGCLAIQVTAITKGSIDVEYNVIVDANQNVNTSTVQKASEAALKDPMLTVFQPNQTVLPAAQASDICQSGHDCSGNSKCILTGDGNYKCECNKGYEMKGTSCKKIDSEDDNKAVKIAVPIVVSAVVLFVIILIICHVHKKKRNIKNFEGSDKPEPNTVGFGTRNNAYEMKK